MIKWIKRTRLFNRLFNAAIKNKVPLYKSLQYGAIYNTEIEKLMKHNDPYFAISMSDIVEDHPGNKNQNNNYYAFATFMPPGENKIVMSYGNIKDKATYNLLEDIIPIRDKDVRLFYKEFLGNFTSKKNNEMITNTSI